MTLPQVPIPAGTPVVYRPTLDPSTGLYSHKCSKCGKFESTVYLGTGVFCLEHTPPAPELHYFNPPTRKDSPESLPPVPCSYLMGGTGFAVKGHLTLGPNIQSIPATSTDPSRLKALEKAVNQAKPMRGE